MSTETMDQHSLTQGRTFTWHELYSPNAQASLDFYTNALGFGVTEMDMGDGNSYKMLTRDDQPVAGIQDTSRPEMQGTPPHWSSYLAVEDVDASLAKCTEAGATVVHGPMDIPTVGRMVLIADPQGAHIWLFQGVAQ